MQVDQDHGNDGADGLADRAADGDDLGARGELGLHLAREHVEPEADDELTRAHPERNGDLVEDGLGDGGGHGEVQGVGLEGGWDPVEDDVR